MCEICTCYSAKMMIDGFSEKYDALKEWKTSVFRPTIYLFINSFNNFIFHFLNWVIHKNSVSSRDVIIVGRHYTGARKDIACLMFTVYIFRQRSRATYALMYWFQIGHQHNGRFYAWRHPKPKNTVEKLIRVSYG